MSKSGRVVHDGNPRIQNTEAGESGVQGQSCVHRELEDSLWLHETLSSKQTRQKTRGLCVNDGSSSYCST